MPKFSVKYSTTGINQIINKLNIISNSAKEGISNNLDEIGEKYTKIAQDNLKNAFHTQRDGDLLASEIHYRKDKKSVSIVAGMFPESIEQLNYAEFGAGMVDKEHPLAKEINWQYDIKEHGEKGWAYYTTSNDKGLINGDSKLVDYDRLVARTTKSEPTLFMYNTKREILTDGYIPNLIIQNIKKR